MIDQFSGATPPPTHATCSRLQWGALFVGSALCFFGVARIPQGESIGLILGGCGWLLLSLALDPRVRRDFVDTNSNP